MKGKVSAMKIGETIQFGKYDWRVLKILEGKALILSDSVIIHRAYHPMLTKIEKKEKSGGDFRPLWTYITWAECELRGFLNGEFYSSFIEEDRARIAETKITATDNPWSKTNGGDDTIDKIFILSIEEAVEYFGDSGMLASRNPKNSYYIDDEYNSARIAPNKTGKPCTWWLRSPGGSYRDAAYVSNKGTICVYGLVMDNIYADEIGVRPALWLDLSAEQGVQADGIKADEPSPCLEEPSPDLKEDEEIRKAEELKNCAEGKHRWAYFGSDFDTEGNRCNIQVCLVCDEVVMVNKRYHP